MHKCFNNYVQNWYLTHIQPFRSHKQIKQTFTLRWMLSTETRKWWDWKERRLMTEDDDEEPSMPIAATPDDGRSRKKRICTLKAAESLSETSQPTHFTTNFIIIVLNIYSPALILIIISTSRTTGQFACYQICTNCSQK